MLYLTFETVRCSFMTKWWHFLLDRLTFCLLIFLWQGAGLEFCVLHTKLQRLRSSGYTGRPTWSKQEVQREMLCYTVKKVITQVTVYWFCSFYILQDSCNNLINCQATHTFFTFVHLLKTSPGREWVCVCEWPKSDRELMFKISLNWSVLQLSKIRRYIWVQLTIGSELGKDFGHIPLRYTRRSPLGAIPCLGNQGNLSFFVICPDCLNPELKLECLPRISWEKTGLPLVCLESKCTRLLEQASWRPANFIAEF